MESLSETSATSAEFNTKLQDQAPTLPNFEESRVSRLAQAAIQRRVPGLPSRGDDKLPAFGEGLMTKKWGGMMQGAAPADGRPSMFLKERVRSGPSLGAGILPPPSYRGAKSAPDLFSERSLSSFAEQENTAENADLPPSYSPKHVKVERSISKFTFKPKQAIRADLVKFTEEKDTEIRNFLSSMGLNSDQSNLTLSLFAKLFTGSDFFVIKEKQIEFSVKTSDPNHWSSVYTKMEGPDQGRLFCLFQPQSKRKDGVTFFIFKVKASESLSADFDRASGAYLAKLAEKAEALKAKEQEVAKQIKIIAEQKASLLMALEEEDEEGVI